MLSNKATGKYESIFKNLEEERHWKKIYPMGKLEHEALEYVKKYKSFTPGKVMTFLNTKGHKIGYAQATRIVDTLYVHGYVDQMAFYWEKGEIKYVGK